MAKEHTVTPEDGARLENVKISLKSIVDRLLASWKCSLLSKYFPSITSKEEIILQKIISTVAEDLQRNLLRDLAEIVETEMKEPLQRLSNMVTQCPKDTKAWRPSGDPIKDLAAHDLKVLQYEYSRLCDVLVREQQNTLLLKNKVLKLRNKVSENERELLNVKERCVSLMEESNIITEHIVASGDLS
ncbi:uncharacterized protein LOC108672875 [Hyalella azteca]|uniref:Uncharacterized protein LOC108672875 n=1 Tax=Hyalella azteca TaxID=294128 RepID=A0A8B7NQY3_HYAAZ|nr:uncharacterized protein LOC108672875 [Hyalella azteca]